MSRMSWKEFYESGMFWFANRVLSVFGGCLVLRLDEQTGDIVEVYPARTKSIASNAAEDWEARHTFLQALDTNIGKTVFALDELPEADRARVTRVMALTVEDDA